MTFKKIVVAGGGVLGSQIAYQCAYSGFDVTIWLRSEGSIGRTKSKIEELYKTYKNAINVMNSPDGKLKGNWSPGISSVENFDYNKCIKSNDDALGKITYEIDIAKATSDADLVIESVIEDKNQKIDFYKNLSKHIPEKTIIVSNTSTMLPSTFAKYTGKPEKYLCLHFSTGIWFANIAEIMPHENTNQIYYDQIVEFAKQMNMVPFCLHKEQPGYIINTILIPFLVSSLQLWATDVTNTEAVDMCWNICDGGMGPFAIIDMIGLTTVYHIISSFPDADDQTTPNGKVIIKLKEMIDANKLGVQTGEGFYKY